MATRQQKRMQAWAERRKTILARRDAGETLTSIGKSYGVTPERVRQICTKERRAIIMVERRAKMIKARMTQYRQGVEMTELLEDLAGAP